MRLLMLGEAPTPMRDRGRIEGWVYTAINMTIYRGMQLLRYPLHPRPAAAPALATSEIEADSFACRLSSTCATCSLPLSSRPSPAKAGVGPQHVADDVRSSISESLLCQVLSPQLNDNETR